VVLELSGELGDEASPWVQQANSEAELCLVAMDLLERDIGDAEVGEMLIDLLTRWPKVRSGAMSVFGPRFAINPTFGTSTDGRWALQQEPVIENRNATDVLCRAALTRHTSTA
jgi:hypothetical protein